MINLCFMLVIFRPCANAQLPDAPKPKDQQSSSLPAILAPQITRRRMDVNDKFRLYLHQAFNPVALLLPLVGTGLRMANPPDHYPRDWKDGGAAFGRLYGDTLARRETQQAVQFLTQITFREDPRYLPSTSHNVFARTFHAVAFAIVDKSDSGHNRPAYSNFTGAAANGFMGMVYLPGGYNDLVHAGQRSASVFEGFATSNISNEFCPEWGPWMMKLHLPFVHPPCEERIKARKNNAAPAPPAAPK